MCVCNQNHDCENYIGSVYVGGYCGICESELCVFSKLCPVGFLVVCECLLVLLQSIVMSYVGQNFPYQELHSTP